MPNCKNPGHDDENCSSGANMDNLPPKWILTEAQKKIIELYKQAKKHSDQKWNDTNNFRQRI